MPRQVGILVQAKPTLYPACRQCNRKTRIYQNDFYCSKCQLVQPESLRYRVPIALQMGHQLCHFVVFGDAWNIFIGQEATVGQILEPVSLWYGLAVMAEVNKGNICNKIQLIKPNDYDASRRQDESHAEALLEEALLHLALDDLEQQSIQPWEHHKNPEKESSIVDPWYESCLEQDSKPCSFDIYFDFELVALEDIVHDLDQDSLTPSEMDDLIRVLDELDIF